MSNYSTISGEKDVTDYKKQIAHLKIENKNLVKKLDEAQNAKRIRIK
jgi:hypothetical protein